MLSIRGIDHLVLRVRDPDAMLAFYCGVLGCILEKRQDKIGLIQLRAGQQLRPLRRARDPPPPGRPRHRGR